MFAEIELGVQSNLELFAVRFISDVFNHGGLPIPNEIVSHFEEFQANQFVISCRSEMSFPD